jgi:spermidine synthase
MGGDRAAVAAIATCFFASGLGSLVLEMVWTRQLRLVFGSTTLATSTVLVAYMLGLGLGALAGGRLVPRLRDGVRAYALIEIAIGAYALAVPWLLAVFPWVNRVWLHALPFWPAALCRFGLALVVLLVPTLLMGATLPVLVSAVVRDRATAGRGIALLYGLNTLGAVTGVFLTTFALLPALGLYGTNVFGALADMLVGTIAATGLAALVPAPPHGARDLARDAGAPSGKEARAERDWPVLAAYSLVGFTALVYEVAWTRALALVLGSSIYAFAAMLGAFLAGIALGSLAAHRRLDAMAAPRRALAPLIVSLAVVSLAASLLIPRLPGAFVWLALHLGVAADRLLLTQVGLAAAVMLPSALVLGALFPLVACVLAREGRSSAAATATAYWTNTVGSASGAFAAGFVLLPLIGLRSTLALAAALDLVAAAGLLVSEASRGRVARRALPAAAVVAAVLVLLLPLPWDPDALTQGVFRDPLAHLDVGVRSLPLEGEPPPGIVFYRDGPNATVSVHRLPNGHLLLRVNGKTDASSHGDLGTQVLLGQLPLVFGARAERVCVIGLASGVTAGAVARHPVARIDVVEIEPAVVEASRWFDHVSGAPLDDPRVHVVIEDGRTHLASEPGAYDVVISEPSNPWISGVSDLFTREFFRDVRAALRPGGRFLQWIQLYEIDPASILAVLAALRQEFPYVYGFVESVHSPDLLVLATTEPLERAGLPRFETLPAGVRDDLERIEVFSTPDLWSLIRILPEDVDRLVAGASVVNSDANLFLEIRAPRLLYQPQEVDNHSLFVPFEEGVLPLAARSGVADPGTVGALVYAYATRRSDRVVADRLADVAEEHGASPWVLAASAVIGVGEGDVDRDTALATLATAAALLPDAVEPQLARIALLRASGRTAEAATETAALLAQHPDDRRTRVLQFELLQALERRPEARAALDALPPAWRAVDDIDLIDAEARLELAEGRPDVAAELLARTLRAFALGWSDGWHLLAEAHERRGDADAARRARLNAERATRNTTLEYVEAARRAERQDDLARAQVLLEVAVRREPGDRDLQRELASLRTRRGGR